MPAARITRPAPGRSACGVRPAVARGGRGGGSGGFLVDAFRGGSVFFLKIPLLPPPPLFCRWLFVGNVIGGGRGGGFGSGVPMAGGLVVGGIGFGLMCNIGATTPFIYMALALFLVPLGTGITVPAMTASVLASIERQRAGTASAMLNTARQVGGAMGVALFGGLVAPSDITSGLNDAFRISTILLILAAAIAWTWVKAQPQHS